MWCGKEVARSRVVKEAVVANRVASNHDGLVPKRTLASATIRFPSSRRSCLFSFFVDADLLLRIPPGSSSGDTDNYRLLIGSKMVQPQTTSVEPWV